MRRKIFHFFAEHLEDEGNERRQHFSREKSKEYVKSIIDSQWQERVDPSGEWL